MGEPNRSITLTSTSELSRPIENTAADVARLRKLREIRDAKNTRRAYKADWEHFEAWCRARGGDPALATPTNVAAYLAQLPEEGFRYSSIARASAGIMRALAAYDRGAWLSRPFEVQETLKLLAKQLGRAPQDAKRPMTLDIVGRALHRAYPGKTLLELRNRSMVLLGYFLAARRSELVALLPAHFDTHEHRKGITVTLIRSKTDQEGEGFSKFVYRQEELCPVQALQEWLSAAGLLSSPGPIYRRISSSGRVLDLAPSDEAVSEAVKQAAKYARLDPDHYGAHSLRAGFITDAAAQGIPLERIALQTGHRSLEQLRKYIRRLHPAENNPTEGFAARAKLVKR